MITKVSPAYPQKALHLRKDGGAVVEVIVTKDGRVEDACIFEVHPRGLGFEEAAVATVKQWRYRPATKDGSQVDILMVILVEWDGR